MLSQDQIANLIKDVRALTDQRISANSHPSNSDEEIKRALQRSANMLYYDLIDTAENYSVKEVGTNQGEGIAVERYGRISMPEDFYKIKLVGQVLGEGNIREIKEANINKIYKTNAGFYDYYRDGYHTSDYDLKYIFINKTLVIVPEDRNEGLYAYIYNPDAPELENLDVPKGYLDFLVYDACIDAGGSIESDVREWITKRDQLKMKIQEWASNRNSLYPNKIVRSQTRDETVDDFYIR